MVGGPEKQSPVVFSTPPPHVQVTQRNFYLTREFEIELELIQTQMAQKPMLRAEVYARALRASQNLKESGGMGGRAMRLMSGRGVGECGSGRHLWRDL